MQLRPEVRLRSVLHEHNQNKLAACQIDRQPERSLVVGLICIEGGHIPQVQARFLVERSVQRNAIVDSQCELHRESNGASGMTANQCNAVRCGLVTKSEHQVQMGSPFHREIVPCPDTISIGRRNTSDSLRTLWMKSYSLNSTSVSPPSRLNVAAPISIVRAIRSKAS